MTSMFQIYCILGKRVLSRIVQSDGTTTMGSHSVPAVMNGDLRLGTCFNPMVRITHSQKVEG